MLWAILALLGVPIWLIVGGLAMTFWGRSKFKKQDGVFPTKMRIESGSAPGVGKKWPPMSSFALWVHDMTSLTSEDWSILNRPEVGEWTSLTKRG